MGDGWKRARDAARATRPKRITQAKAARLVAAIAVIKECEDITTGPSIALDDARAEIDPFYDRTNR